MTRQIQGSSEYSNRSRAQKRSYISVKYEDRVTVVREVYYRRRRIIDVSREMGINPSTVKMIVHRFRNSGLIFQKREERQAREAQQRAILYWYMYMYQYMWWQCYWNNYYTSTLN